MKNKMVFVTAPSKGLKVEVGTKPILDDKHFSINLNVETNVKTTEPKRNKQAKIKVKK